MFEMNDKTMEPTLIMETITNEIKIIDSLWKTIDKIQGYFDGYLKLEWQNIKPSEMQEEVKDFLKELKGIKNLDRKSNVSQGVFKEIQNWSQFLPILEELKKDAMIVPDNRHWKQFGEIINQNFNLTDQTKLKVFWDLELFSPLLKEKIEELTEKST